MIVRYAQIIARLKIPPYPIQSDYYRVPTGVWGPGENSYLFIFRTLWSTGNYFKGAREQARSFGDIGSSAKKQKKNNEKPPFCLIF